MATGLGRFAAMAGLVLGLTAPPCLLLAAPSKANGGKVSPPSAGPSLSRPEHRGDPLASLPASTSAPHGAVLGNKARPAKQPLGETLVRLAFARIEEAGENGQFISLAAGTVIIHLEGEDEDEGNSRGVVTLVVPGGERKCLQGFCDVTIPANGRYAVRVKNIGTEASAFTVVITAK